MRYQHQRQGYVLLVAVMVVSLSVVLFTRIANRAAAHIPHMQTVIDHEKATMLALGGIQLAMSQLAMHEEQEEKEKDTKKTTGGSMDKQAKKFLARILPILNRWQQYKLKEEVEGIDGYVRICIMCENGKIDINQLYDFENHEFKKPWNKIVEGTRQTNIQQLFVLLEKKIGRAHLFEPFEKFLKERQYKLDDVTELLTIKDFDIFKQTVFYEPPDEKKGKKEKKDYPLYLTDIFTIWSGKAMLEPWLLSDSCKVLLDLKKVENSRMQDQGQMVQEWLKEFKINAQWPTDWDTVFLPIYGKDFTSLPKSIESILASKFEPKIFSVLSYGNVGGITQKFFAIIERFQPVKDNAGLCEVTIKKVYWI